MAGETQLGKAVIPIRASLDDLDRDLSSARGKITGALGGLGRGIGVAGAAILGAGTAAVGVLGSIAVQTAPLEGVQNAFQGIATDADGMLASLRDGSRGMIADAELMRQYNQAAQLVGVTFADELPDAMGYLGKVSAATGGRSRETQCHCSPASGLIHRPPVVEDMARVLRSGASSRLCR